MESGLEVTLPAKILRKIEDADMSARDWIERTATRLDTLDIECKRRPVLPSGGIAASLVNTWKRTLNYLDEITVPEHVMVVSPSRTAFCSSVLVGDAGFGGAACLILSSNMMKAVDLYLRRHPDVVKEAGLSGEELRGFRNHVSMLQSSASRTPEPFVAVR